MFWCRDFTHDGIVWVRAHWTPFQHLAVMKRIILCPLLLANLSLEILHDIDQRHPSLPPGRRDLPQGGTMSGALPTCRFSAY